MSMTGPIAGAVQAFYQGSWWPARIVRRLVDERVLVEVRQSPGHHHRVALPADLVRFR